MQCRSNSSLVLFLIVTCLQEMRNTPEPWQQCLQPPPLSFGMHLARKRVYFLMCFQYVQLFWVNEQKKEIPRRTLPMTFPEGGWLSS